MTKPGVPQVEVCKTCSSVLGTPHEPGCSVGVWERLEDALGALPSEQRAFLSQRLADNGFDMASRITRAEASADMTFPWTKNKDAAVAEDPRARETSPETPKSKRPPASDSVNHPSHYTFGRFEVIEVIEDWGLGFHEANAVKYIARAGKKDPAKHVEDLRKAAWYINRRIAHLQGTRDE